MTSRKVCVFPDALETERLRLRRFRLADAPVLAAYRSDPEVARYQDWDRMTDEQARLFIEEQAVAELGIPDGWLQIAIERKSDNAVIGDVGLHCGADDVRQGEIGYTLATQYQGHGYAAEAVATVLDYVFECDLEMHRVAAVVDVRNDRSVALAERLGMRREAHFRENVWFKGSWGDEYVYAVLRDEWRQRRAPATS